MSAYFDLLVLAFACFRLTHLIVNDKITEFLRRPFHDTIEEELPDGTTETFIVIKGTGLRYWIGELLSCHWCTGMWSAAAIYAAYYIIPEISMPAITVLAIAGFASSIQAIISR
jgi:hypothetical protein